MFKVALLGGLYVLSWEIAWRYSATWAAHRFPKSEAAVSFATAIGA